MSEQQALFNQLFQIVLKYYPYQEGGTYQEQQERKEIVHQNWKSVQMWQEFAGNYVEYDKRAEFLGQINTALNIFPLVDQYLTIKSQNYSLKKIETIQVKQFYQTNSILKEFQIKMKQRIYQHLNNSSNIQEYLTKQISFIVDILQRRSKLNEYFKFLVQQSRNIPHFAQKLGVMKLVDFIIILQRFVYPNDIILFLIAQQSAPSPVQFTAIDQHINYANQFVNLLKFKKHHLVLNIWSYNSKQYVINRSKDNKRVLFSHALQIDPICFTGSHFEEVINLYQLIVKQKEMVFIDYVEKKKQYQNQQNNLIIKLFKQAQIVIFHIDQKDLQQQMELQKKSKQLFKQKQEIMKQTDQYLFFLQKYQVNKTNSSQLVKFFCQQISNKILTANITQYIDQFYDFVTNQDIFRYQSNPNQSKIPSLTSFYKIFQSLGKQTMNKIFDVNKLSQQKLKRYANYEEIKSFLNFQISNSQKIHNLPKVCTQRELNKVRVQKNTLSIQQIRLEIQKQLTQQNGGQNHTHTMLQVLQKSNEQYMNILHKLSKKQEALQKQLLVVKLSDFVQSCKKYIRQENGIQIQEFNSGLIQQINQTLSKQLSILSELYPGELKKSKEYKDAKDKIMSTRMTIDEIYYQYNVFNELTIDKKKQNPTSFQQLNINNYYHKCLNNQISFNFVDGETSNFGHKSLQRFFQQIKRKQEEESKEIFVICAIGPKSSGKSALFNYLFHYNIHMREDEFAKGIYVGQCQMSKKFIVVLDAAGIMQIEFGKDNYQFSYKQLGQIFATFDHQVASLLLKVCDLVVFAGYTESKKGHIIPQQLQLAVGVCYKVLNAIQVNNYTDQKKVIPKRIMFALNKNSENSPNIDKELAIQLMINNLQLILLPQDPNGEKNPRKLFQKYMRLQAQDIFQLPSIYRKSDFIQKVNETYGLQILGLRSKILQHLEKIKSHRVNAQQLIGFYRKAQTNWDLIMVTGSNILKVQSLTESYERQIIYQLFRQIHPQIYQQMIKNINIYLPETNCQALIFTPSEVQQQIKKLKQQSTFDSWTFFSIKLSAYLTVIYKSQQNKPSIYDNIMDQSVKVFSKQAQKIIPDLTRYQELYLFSIKQLFDIIFYRRISEYYRQFENVFAIGVQDFTIGKIFSIILQLNIEDKFNQKERQQIFDQQTDKILNSEYFMPIKREVVSSNLNSVFGTILSTENVFINELQIQSINDCLNFDQQINQNYINNLNQFIFFENYEEVKQNYRAQFARLLEKNIKEYNQSVVNYYTQKKITNFDIIGDFSHFKAEVIDLQITNLSDQIKQVSERIYQQIALLDKDKTYYKLQQRLEKEEQELSLKKAEQVKSLQQVQASLAKISQNMKEATSEEKKILKKQEEQLLLQKQKQTQDLEEIERQIVYLLNIRSSTFNLSQQRIALTKINFVILLLAKMFNNLQQIIYNQQVAQLNKLKANFVNDVNTTKQTAIKNLGEQTTQFTKSIQLDYNSSKCEWQKQFKRNWTNVYKTTVYKNIQRVSKSSLKQSIEKDTINKTDLSQLTKEDIKKHYIQCYKYVINPHRYLIETLYSQLTASSQIASMIDQAYLSIDKQINQILHYKPPEIDKDESILIFLKQKQLNNMHAFVDPYNKNNTIFTPTDIINEFIKKLAAENSALEKEIKKIAFDKQMIEHVQAEVLKARDKVIGCTSCCPFCGAICIDNTLNHSGQHTANHYTTAFGGCRDNNNVILVQNCGRDMKKNYWSYDYKAYNDHYFLLKRVFQGWTGQFENGQSPQQQNRKFEKVWANIQGVTINALKKRHFYKYGLHQSRLSNIIDERRNNNYVSENDIKANKLENYWVNILKYKPPVK